MAVPWAIVSAYLNSKVAPTNFYYDNTANLSRGVAQVGVAGRSSLLGARAERLRESLANTPWNSPTSHGLPVSVSNPPFCGPIPGAGSDSRWPLSEEAVDIQFGDKFI